MNNLSEYKISLSELELGAHRFDFQLDNAYISAIEKTELLGGKVACSALLTVAPDTYTLSLKVQGVVQLTCDRCLDPMNIAVDAADDDVELEPNQQVVDLPWLAYELVIVTLPMVHSHQEGGCNPQMVQLLQDHLCTLSVETEDK